MQMSSLQKFHVTACGFIRAHLNCFLVHSIGSFKFNEFSIQVHFCFPVDTNWYINIEYSSTIVTHKSA